MLIAGKYEEIYPPRIVDYVEITDRAYTKDDVRRMEVKILSEVQFELTVTSAFRFLERYSRLAQSPQLQYSLALYALELSLIEVSMNRYMPDTLACAALYASRKLTVRNEFPWPAFMFQQTGHAEADLRDCARDICFILAIAHQKRYYQSLYRKFSAMKYQNVAEFIARRSSAGKAHVASQQLAVSFTSPPSSGRLAASNHPGAANGLRNPLSGAQQH